MVGNEVTGDTVVKCPRQCPCSHRVYSLVEVSHKSAEIGISDVFPGDVHAEAVGVERTVKSERWSGQEIRVGQRAGASESR